MAFTTIPGTDIEVGKPTKKSIFQKTKDNFDDHETRISALTAGAAKIENFVFEVANLAQYSPNGSSLERISLFRASRDMTIVNVQVYVLHSSSGSPPTAGTLELDILKGSTLATLSTIFTVKPSVTTFAEEDTNGAVAFVATGEDVSQGDWLQLDITSLQTDQSRIFIDVFSEPA